MTNDSNKNHSIATERDVTMECFQCNNPIALCTCECVVCGKVHDCSETLLPNGECECCWLNK